MRNIYCHYIFVYDCNKIIHLFIVLNDNTIKKQNIYCQRAVLVLEFLSKLYCCVNQSITNQIEANI